MNYQQFVALLDETEKVRANRFHFEIHRDRFTKSRGLLRQLCGEYLQCSPQEISFEYNEYGKPFIKGCGISFNLSHSEDLVTIGFSQNKAIGVDVEWIKETYEDNVAKRFFSVQEYAQLSELSESERCSAFYHIWSRKEAFIKALGKGIHYPLADFSVPVSLNDLNFKIDIDRKQWFGTSLNVDEHYACALITDDAAFKVTQINKI